MSPRSRPASRCPPAKARPGRDGRRRSRLAAFRGRLRHHPGEPGPETLAAISSPFRQPQQYLSTTSGHPGNLAIMQSARPHPPSHHDHLAATGPAVEDHGRAVTANQRAAECYRQAQRAVDLPRAITALRRAVSADPAFELALADLGAITGTAARGPSHRQMNWERHHIEVVRAAASGNAVRAADLLSEHLASVGCDPLAVRIAVQLRQLISPDELVNLAGQLPSCHPTPWPCFP